MSFSFYRFTQYLKLRSFHRRRDAFYEALGQALQRGEALNDFLRAQLSQASQQREPARVHAVQRLQSELPYHPLVPKRQLGDLLLKVMPRADAGMLDMLDAAPDQPAALRALAEAVRWHERLRRLIAQHIALPLGLVGLCLAGGLFSSWQLLFTRESLPAGVTAAGFFASDGFIRLQYLMAQGLGVAAALFLSGLLMTWILPRWYGPWRHRLDRGPFFSLYRDVQACRLLTTLPMRLQAGQTLVPALKALAPYRRARYWRYAQVSRALQVFEQHPRATFAAFNHGLLSPRWVQRMAHAVRDARDFRSALIHMGTRDAAWMLARLTAHARLTFMPLVAVLLTLNLLLAASHLLAFRPAPPRPAAAAVPSSPPPP